MTVQKTDLLRVNRGGADFQVALGDKTRIHKDDLMVVNRGGKDYQLPCEMKPAIKRTDLVKVNRGGVDYQTPWRFVRALFGRPAIIMGKPQPDQIQYQVLPGLADEGTPPYTYVSKWQISDDGRTGWRDVAGISDKIYYTTIRDVGKYLRSMTIATDSAGLAIELPSRPTEKIHFPVVSPWEYESYKDTQGHMVGLLNDTINRYDVHSRYINIHACMRRCLVTDAGKVTYLDADDSTKLAGDWLRLCETSELDTPYTGTHQGERDSYHLRGGVEDWVSDVYYRGERVIWNYAIWECLAESTTAEPLPGTSPAALDGSAGQVMVEVPRYSLSYKASSSVRSEVNFGNRDGFCAVHPAFAKPDGTFREFIYIGAYLGSGANGAASVSAAAATASMTRSQARTACAGRGAGWHLMGYLEFNAVEWLFATEYQSVDSKRYLGKGISTTPAARMSGASNARGNRSGCLSADPTNTSKDYVSYRGVENIHADKYTFADGFNFISNNYYASNDPSKWADGATADYTQVIAQSTGMRTAYPMPLLGVFHKDPNDRSYYSVDDEEVVLKPPTTGSHVIGVAGNRVSGMIGLKIDLSASSVGCYSRLVYAP